jgi:hypothetical protein
MAAWWIPLVIEGARMAKSEYDKQQAQKKAKDSASKAPNSGGYIPELDFNFEEYDPSFGGSQETVSPPMAPAQAPAPAIDATADQQLRAMQMTEASRGLTPRQLPLSAGEPLPTSASYAPYWYNQKLLQRDESTIRNPEYYRGR